MIDIVVDEAKAKFAFEIKKNDQQIRAQAGSMAAQLVSTGLIDRTSVSDMIVVAQSIYDFLQGSK